jgi:D-alanine-D-alanine ligase
MRVAILFDDVESRSGSTPDELGVLESVVAAEEALAELGHEAIRVPAGPECGEWSRVLERSSPDVVFNLCEGLGGRSDGEVLAARVVEGLGLPKTGNSSDTLALAHRKDRVNALLEELGLPVPPWSVWNGESAGETLHNAQGACPVASWRFFPAIVKPVAEDASVGITQDAVVGEPDGLSRRLEAVRHLSPLLVQAFVGTREINVGIVGGEVLPLAEILFDDLPRGFHPLVGYEAKWSPGSKEDIGTRPLCPARLTPSLARRVRSLSLKVWRAVGGCGYGRVDLRLTEPDTLHVLEVNPNPDLAPSAGLARMATVAGWSYTEMLQRILAEAVRTSEAFV